MSVESRFALLIGVNEYRDARLPGLRGPRNDVAGWFKLLRRLGVPAANIQILTSPALTQDELGDDEAVCGEATSASVSAAVAAFGAALATRKKDAVGFTFYSGHGSLIGSDPSVCLADSDGAPPTDGGTDPVRGGFLFQAASQEALAKAAPGASITCIWDTCRCEPDPEAAAMMLMVPPRIFSVPTALGGQDAYERCFDGMWRGQFSWAALTLLDQWPHLRHAGTPYVAISWITLLYRVDAFLQAFNGTTAGHTSAGLLRAVAAVVEEEFGPGHPVAQPADRLLSSLARALPGEGMPAIHAVPEWASTDPARVFLLPFDERAPTCPSAKDAPTHEFPTGTTEFWSPAYAGGTRFGLVNVTTSGVVYTFQPSMVSGGVVQWPAQFEARYTTSGGAWTAPAPVVWSCLPPPRGTTIPTSGWGWGTATADVLLAAGSGWNRWGVCTPSGSPPPAHLFVNHSPGGNVQSGATVTLVKSASPLGQGSTGGVWTDTKT